MILETVYEGWLHIRDSVKEKLKQSRGSTDAVASKHTACTYSSIMPSWIRSSFFDPELERSRLETHTYCDSESVKTMRQMKASDVWQVYFWGKVVHICLQKRAGIQDTTELAGQQFTTGTEYIIQFLL